MEKIEDLQSGVLRTIAAEQEILRMICIARAAMHQSSAASLQRLVSNTGIRELLFFCYRLVKARFVSGQLIRICNRYKKLGSKVSRDVGVKECWSVIDTSSFQEL